MAFCQQFKGEVKQLIKQFDGYVETHVDIALQVTTKLKAILNSPITGIVTAIIPGNLDNVIRAKLIQGLGYSIDALNIVDECKNQGTIEQKVQCFAAALVKEHPDMQDAILQKLAALLARFLGGNTTKQNIYDLFVQAKFSVAKA
ncbi:MAG: hypothetical protein EPN37_04495 [Chitinophagaceae bacterium]|nr:MAG: hypothetical protein EPN37_04495 [Chitinophagaceae bacterium]